MDPDRDYSNPHNLTIKCYYIAISMCTGVFLMIFINVNSIYSATLLVIYFISLIVYIFIIPDIQNKIGFQSFFSFIVATILAIKTMFKLESNSKQLFHNHFKLQRILSEQKMLLDNILDGALMYDIVGESSGNKNEMISP